ncbi:MAG: HEAT repeat domain-containing protein, partial [Planctomycetota bacterium]
WVAWAGAAGAPGAAAAPAHAPAASGSGLAMVLASMAILLTAAVAVLLFERMDEAGRTASAEAATVRSALAEGLDELRDELGAGREARDDEERRVARELAGLQAREEERGKAQAASEQRLSEEIAALGERLAVTAGFTDGLAQHDRQIEELADTITEIRADIGVIAEKVVELEQRGVAAAAAAPVVPVVPMEEQPVWMTSVQELASPSAGERWGAVQALGDTGDVGVVPHLLPMLKDSDIFVRMATARVLGDLAAPEGVPALIDALEDSEATVREAAVVSLRSITGKDFKFDPNAKDGDRAKRVKAWCDWWRREGEDALGRA